MILTRGMLTTHLFHCPAMGWKHLKSEVCSDETDYSAINIALESKNKNDSEDEHVYEKLPKRKKKSKRNCKVM
jgi:hypothetical protein